jgi:membrane protein implicated in regulation of membrane protease activity
LFDTVFAFLHLGGLLAALVYAVVSLLRGNVTRFALVLALLAIYYVFLLHPAVKKEIARRRSLKNQE